MKRGSATTTFGLSYGLTIDRTPLCSAVTTLCWLTYVFSESLNPPLILSSIENIFGTNFYLLLPDLFERAIALCESPMDPLLCIVLLSDLCESSNSIKFVFWVYLSVPTRLLIGDMFSFLRDGLSGLGGVFERSTLDY